MAKTAFFCIQIQFQSLTFYVYFFHRYYCSVQFSLEAELHRFDVRYLCDVLTETRQCRQ